MQNSSCVSKRSACVSSECRLVVAQHPQSFAMVTLTILSLLLAPHALVLSATALLFPAAMKPAAGVCACAFVGFMLRLRQATLRFCGSAEPYQVVRTGATEKETRPASDAVFHVLFFVWGVFGRRGRLYQHLLRALNRQYDDWDTPFAALGTDASSAVLAYCARYGVQVEPWVWSKPAADYTTHNDWFARKYRAELSPERNLGDAAVLMPATAVTSWYSSAAELPVLVKNEQFTLEGSGVPEPERYRDHPCCILYLAPVDYHCYHAPIGGAVVHCALLGLEAHSASVKPYIYEHVNILASNRRAVVVLQGRSRGGKALRCAMVVIGGVTVDSIRLETAVMQPDAEVACGQLLGCFARGGSSIALFFDHDVELLPEYAALHAQGLPFKLDAGVSLANLVE